MALHQQKSTIPFRRRLEANDFQVDLPIHRKYLSQPETKFRFETLLIEPEYYSIQAAHYDMDPIVEDIEIPVQVEINWNQVFVDNPIGTAWVSSASRGQELANIIKTINMHFDLQRPTGVITPLIFFDWIFYRSQIADMNLKEFHLTSVPMWYDNEDYNEEKHNSYVPDSIKNLPFVNSLLYPTSTDLETQESIRVRLHVSPNAYASFSNEVLLKALGFSEETILAQKGSRNFVFKNRNPHTYMCIEADMAPPALLISELKSTRLVQYLGESTVLSDVGIVLTNRTHQLKPTTLASDFNKTIKNLAETLNIRGGMQFDSVEKKFKLSFSEDSKFTMALRLDSLTAKLLGYSAVDRITSIMNPDIIEEVADITESEKRARTLVYDTGMIIVCNTEETSLQTDQFEGIVMATLEPNYDGTMSSHHYQNELPAVNVSYSQSGLNLALYRFDEEGKPIPLGWKIAAYLQGKLVATL